MVRYSDSVYIVNGYGDGHYLLIDGVLAAVKHWLEERDEGNDDEMGYIEFLDALEEGWLNQGHQNVQNPDTCEPSKAEVLSHDLLSLE